MRYHYEIVLKRWLPILKEYEKTKSKVTPRSFKFEYNHLRKHSGLDYQTPFDKLQKVTELLS